MTPHRSHDSGSLIIDKRYHGIGRVRRASGTTNEDVFRRMLAAFDELEEKGRLDLLIAMRDRLLHPLELYDAYRSGELARLPTAEDLKPLVPAIEAWLPALQVVERTRLDYARMVKRVYEGRVRARVADLPRLVAEFRLKCENKRRSFNLTKAACQSFLHSFVGRDHRLYKALSKVPDYAVTPRKGNPLSVDRVRELAAELQQYGSMLWALCLTGMRRGEYWGKWDISGDRVLIHGTKTAGSERFIPFVFPVVRPMLSFLRFGQKLHDLTGGHVRIHDTRKTFSVWLELAGIPRTRRNIYRGHGKHDIGDLYEEHDVREFLASDAEKLRAFIGGPPAIGLAVAQ